MGITRLVSTRTSSTAGLAVTSETVFAGAFVDARASLGAESVLVTGVGETTIDLFAFLAITLKAADTFAFSGARASLGAESVLATELGVLSADIDLATDLAIALVSLLAGAVGLLAFNGAVSERRAG